MLVIGYSVNAKCPIQTIHRNLINPRRETIFDNNSLYYRMKHGNIKLTRDGLMFYKDLKKQNKLHKKTIKLDSETKDKIYGCFEKGWDVHKIAFKFKIASPRITAYKAHWANPDSAFGRPKLH